MAKPDISTKRVAINKANLQMVIIMSVASFVTVFCLVASRAIWSTTRYQSRVTSKENIAHQQLQNNIQAFDQLVNSYKSFDSATTNVIGGSSSGSGPNDGENAQIVLDALPNKYDFPALASSIEAILHNGHFDIASISGTDNQLNEQGNTSSPTPQTVQMPFSFTVNNVNYSSIQQLISTLQSSIRPIAIDSLTLTGGANSMTLTVNAHTFYQPGKTVTISQQVVK